MKSAARRGGETPGRTPRRLGAPRREVATGSSTDKKVKSAAKTPKSEDAKTPVRRSPRLALMFARSSEKKSGSGGFSRDEIDDEIGAQESICVADAGEENIEDAKTHGSSRGIDRET